MSTSGQQTKPLTAAGLRQFIARAVERNFVREAFHSECERASRNISDEDVLYGLERGDWVLAKSPDYDFRHKNWEYLIKTHDIEGDELHLKIAVFQSDGRLIVITKY